MRAIVVGAGVVGLSAALALQEMGVADVVVLERFSLGHSRGSSHGELRITRSAYTDPLWVELVRIAREEDWTRLERDTGETLIEKWPSCFFGPTGGPIDDVGRAVRAAGADVEELSLADARRMFPGFRFADGDRVLDDRTAGVIRAARTMRALARLCVARGVVIREEVRVDHIERGAVSCAGERIEADAIVVAAGPFTRELLPDLPIRVTRQRVAYYAFEHARALPVWACFDRELFYGLPDVGSGAKAARHIVQGDDDPLVERDPDEDELLRVDTFVRARFQGSPRRLTVERCLYTMAPNEDFVIDTHAPGIAVATGLSGHGFKLAPLVGRIVAELALLRPTSVAPFRANARRFASHRTGSLT